MTLKKTKELYHHDIMNCTSESLIGNYLYSGRALGITRTEDAIVLHPELKTELKTICEHYNRIGLPCSQNIIWAESAPSKKHYPEHRFSSFFFDQTSHDIQPDQPRLKITDFINNKNNFISLAKELGIPVPETFCFSSKKKISFDLPFSYPCFLKAAISVGGKGIYKCHSQQELLKSLDHFDIDTPLQVQRALFTETFLNVQYNATKDGLEPLAITEQVLDGYTHTGNRFPVSYDVWENTDPIAQWLFDKGLKGIFAFDVAVINNGNENIFLPIECNPRYNGASYPTLIASKLGLSSWASMRVSSEYTSLNHIDIKDLEFNAETGTGIILVNWGTVLKGKLGIMIAGELSERELILKNFYKRVSKASLNGS
ncbi:MAG: ATP-grasp domain-containing protein [Candidatus Brocadiaceae bacterium]|nr:ATP-grasp domain-containing protein [Candidatus Brocadiaceae bacterium]